MNIEMLAVLVICLLVFPVFYLTKSYFSKNGILLFILGFSAFYLRILLFGKYPPLAVLNKETLFLSVIILLIPLGLFMAYSFLKKGEVLPKRRSYFFRLLILYIFFGALQQLFFLTVFTDSIYYLSSNYLITFFVSVAFFFSLHLNMGKDLRKFLLWVLCFGILNTLVYVWLGNILPQVVLHGVFGSIFFAVFTEEDQLKKRLWGEKLWS